MFKTKQLPEISLFEKVGGAVAIVCMVDRFHDVVTKDPMLEPYFKNVEMDKLRRMHFEFFSAALGGPIQHAGRPIVYARHYLHIALYDSQRFAQHLFDVMAQYPLTEQDRYDIICRLSLYASDVASAEKEIVG